MELEEGEYYLSTEENSPIYSIQQEDDKSIFIPGASLSSHEIELVRLHNNEAEESQALLELRLQIQRNTENMQAQINQVRSDLGELQDQRVMDFANLNARLFSLEQAHVDGRQASGDQLGQVRLLLEQLFHQFNTGDIRNNLEFQHLRQQLAVHRLGHGFLAAPVGDPLAPPTNAAPEPVPVPVPGSTRAPRGRSPRMDCPLCFRNLSKGYVKTHLKKYCSQRPNSGLGPDSSANLFSDFE